MEILKSIATPALVFVLLGVLMGVLLAAATKLFYVKKDERAEEIASVLPGANCGGCGYAGCQSLAEAISAGEAKVSSCTVGGAEVAKRIAEIMGTESGEVVRQRAVIMCVGSDSAAKKKYIYSGADDCAAAARLGGGDKLCPNGCIGLGTCVESCPFGAISVGDGVAQVDPARCRGCGVCVSHCPKNIIKLIPYDSKVSVRCSSHDVGRVVRAYCDAGCIACRICEKKCSSGAISVDGNIASVDYQKCTGCLECVSACPRGIIKS